MNSQSWVVPTVSTFGGALLAFTVAASGGTPPQMAGESMRRSVEYGLVAKAASSNAVRVTLSPGSFAVESAPVEGLVAAYEQFAKSQKPLEQDISEFLADNIWEMLE